MGQVMTIMASTTHEAATLARMGSVLTGPAGAASLTAALDVLAEALEADWLELSYADGDGRFVTVSAGGRVGRRSYAVRHREVLRLGDAAVGTIRVLRRLPWSAGGAALLETAVPMLTLAIGRLVAESDRVRALDAHQQVAARLVAAVEQERMSLAGELHDTLLQTMVAARYAVDLIGIGGQPPLPRVPAAREAVQEAVVEARRELWHLRSRVGATEAGLAGAVAELADYVADAGGPTVCVDATRLVGDVTPLVGTAAYRLIQEAVRALTRGDAALPVEVALESADGDLLVTVLGGNERTLPDAAANGPLARWCDRIRMFGGEVAVQEDTARSRLVARIPHAQPSQRTVSRSV
jgi:signal transduction histidine kinase